MAIDDLKRWHWIVIGAVVGLVLGFAQLMGGNEPTVDLPTIGPIEFEEELRATPRDGSPVLEAITVYPAPAGEADLVVMERRTDWGMYARLRGAGNNGNARQIKYVQHRINLPKPFKPRIPVPGAAAGPNYTVRDYLNDLSRAPEGARVSYRYAWWRQPAVAVTLWTAGGLVVIGIIWPTLLGFLIGAGLGRRAPKDPEYDLSRFQSEPEPMKTPATEGDGRALEDHVRKLEEALAQGLAPGAGHAGGSQTEVLMPVKTLLSAPVEAAAASGDEDREYQGEFYPVVKPHHDEPREPPATSP